jgi:hypothetical protein
MFTLDQTDAVINLSVRYGAYITAVHADDAVGIVVWGEMLAKAQQDTGVTLISSTAIERMVRVHRPACDAIVAATNDPLCAAIVAA